MDASRLKAFGPGPGPDYDPALPAPRTAARVEGGTILHGKAHLARLQESAAALGRSLPWIPALESEIEAWVAASSQEPVEALRLRLIGDRLWALLEPLPRTPEPYHLVPLPHPLDREDSLAPHKGLLGLWSTTPLREAQARGGSDALLHWPDGTLVETAIASIALEVEGVLWLPPKEGRVASLGERLLLPEWAGSRTCLARPFRLKEVSLGRLWCFNALRGIWPAQLL